MIGAATVGRESAWAAVEAQATRLAAVPVSRLFEVDPDRFDACSASAAGLLLDYSRQHVDANSLRALGALADAWCR